MSMLVTGTSRRQEYLDTYGHALQGIRAVLDRPTDSVGPTVAIAGMCLALSEGRSPCAFKDGVAHLMFVGVRPLVVLDAILRRKTTFLMNERWRVIPFSVYPASRMQVLLGHVTAIPPLLEAMEDEQADLQTVRTGFLEVLSTLQDWEDSFVCKGMLYRPIDPSHLDLPTDAQLLPNPCFDFADVSHANSLTHCWAFRIVCMLQLSKLESRLSGSEGFTCAVELKRRTNVSNLCMAICQGIPYLLQKGMSLYGSMSAAFPLHMVSESLQTLQLQDPGLNGWYAAIKEQVQSQRIALYEEMAEFGIFT
ncbi:hypothetical protein BU25DRAFT_428936 [Macroventuria anomochaeta]|uniref:Uncharacterized protein n=1 Tax=Macroventuria anomochaeta TaxID=301207 RepID=A0ACB6SA98_9PLEO|nr:uncharacterized protein BU25DRAFT_428936 [Macroventuria anomochaeta]KAF2631215.1 hypothetical protein BU25DRAFT_428936 [Macroventuria anomochaeta]